MALLSELPACVRFLFVDGGATSRSTRRPPPSRSCRRNAPVLLAAADALEAVDDWTTEAVQAAVDAALIEGGLGLKRGKAYAPIRAAVCGASIAPPLPESMALLGKERVLRRLRAAAAAL